MPFMKSTSISTAAPGAPATLAAPQAISTRSLIVATTIGNAFEFFDLTVYSFFAVLLGKLFFPLASAQQQLLLSEVGS